jgi:tetratricopeptide (TPR) repeat protein
VLFRKTKWLVGMALISAALFGQAKEWKDRAEYELVAEQIGKATDPNKKLELLNQWKQKYPSTNFSWERLGAFLVTYQQLGKAKEMFDTAKEMSAADPKNFTGPYYVNLLVLSMGSTDAAVLEDGEKAANTMLTNLNDYFAADKKPQGVADDAWGKQKADAQLKAHQVLVFAATAKKDWPLVEERLTEQLKANPKNATASYQLGAAILSQRKPEKQVFAIYHFARACGLEGEGAYPADQKAKVCDYFGRVYPQYRGDKKGMDELKAKAASEVFPPTDFAIKTKQQEDIEQLEELKKTNPQLAIWVQMKQELTGPGGAAYLEQIKGAALPKFKGKVVSHEPAVNPTKIVVGISDASAPEITIEIDDKAYLPGSVEPGTELEFEGVGKDFTADPFNLTVVAEKEKISGWTGKPVAPARKAAKKAVRKK